MMNKIIKLFVCFMLLLCTTNACQKEDEKVDSTPYFEVVTNDLIQNFIAESDFRYVTVNTNQAFTATSSETWCTTSIIDDKAANLKIYVAENPGFDGRTAQIVLSSPGFSNITLTINQDKVPVLTVKETEVSIDETKLEFSLEITTNIPVAFELPDWIYEKPNNPTNDGKTWTFIASAEMAPGERSDVIVVKSENAALGKRINLNVYQKINVSKIGSWLFDDPNDLTKATIGNPLTYHSVVNGQYVPVEGPSASNKAIRMLSQCYFQVEHGMYPKTGETFISEFTLFIEFKVPTFTIAGIGTVYYPFFKTRIYEPDSDGDALLRGSDRAIGVGATGYGGSVSAEEWHRIYFSIKPGEIQYFMDGVRIINSNTTDARFRINLDGVIFLGHAVQKREFENWDIAEISLWNGALSQEQILAIENNR